MPHTICDYASIEIRNCTIVLANAKQVTMIYKAPSILASFSAVFHSFKVLTSITKIAVIKGCCGLLKNLRLLQNTKNGKVGILFNK